MSLEWWKKNVIYHLYLPSFKDSNNDGIGDFQGLISKLDYFIEIGVSTLLLSPFYPSPLKDNGYDISSYTDVDPMYGTMEDFDLLMQQAKRRDLNIIVDFVANHTSEQHPWFMKSVQKEDPYTDFFVWVDAKSETVEKQPLPPNNWLSVFGGSAWTWNEQRKQFYFHQFLPEQPDLNYHNPLVRNEMKRVLMFWLEKGVDGFRIDAASHLFEDKELRDEPLAKQSKAKENEYEYLNHIYTKGLEDTFHLLEEWRHVLDHYSKILKKPKIMLIEGMGEVEDVVHYYGSVHQKLAEIPMNFQFYKVTPTSTGLELQGIIDEWLTKMPMGKYPNYVMSSHDFPRVASRVGCILASSLHMVMMLLAGIPICYYGDELGMENGIISPSDMRDSFALRTKASNSRDPMRTPMQWSEEKNAGFTGFVKPWLPVNANYKTVNVEIEKEDPHSFLENFKKLVNLRREASILFGIFEYLLVNENIFSFLRMMVGTKCYLVIVNMSSGSILVDLSTINAPLPHAALLEVTNPQYYNKTKSKYSQNDMEISVAQSSRAAENTSSSDHTENLIIPLNDIYLEAKQAMVLSFER